RLAGPLETGEDREPGAQLPDLGLAIGIALRLEVEEQIVRAARRGRRRQPGGEPGEIGIGGTEADQDQRAPPAQLVEPGHPRRRQEALARVGRADAEAL